ncbi:MAG: AbrB/MazE/SpoVT family DNA-binding domain-containing protein [Chloroflexi bacterium]|nr:AbrB/MazE/SpoVT family DNA-binding domain-containing protein [Chloroflexota bacterium]
MSDIKTKLSNSGRLVIPALYRKALGLKPGDEVVMVLEDDGIKVLGARQAIARSQALVRRYVPKGRKLSDELIKDRREEAARA